MTLIHIVLTFEWWTFRCLFKLDLIIYFVRYVRCLTYGVFQSAPKYTATMNEVIRENVSLPDLYGTLTLFFWPVVSFDCFSVTFITHGLVKHFTHHHSIFNSEYFLHWNISNLLMFLPAALISLLLKKTLSWGGKSRSWTLINMKRRFFHARNTFVVTLGHTWVTAKFLPFFNAGVPLRCSTSMTKYFSMISLVL